MKITDKFRQFASVLGIFLATVIITYAASSLIPTYAPGQNPPSLDQAPLLYRMAGQTDPDSFDYANDSLKAIGEKLDTINAMAQGSNVDTKDYTLAFMNFLSYKDSTSLDTETSMQTLSDTMGCSTERKTISTAYNPSFGPGDPQCPMGTFKYTPNTTALQPAGYGIVSIYCVGIVCN